MLVLLLPYLAKIKEAIFAICIIILYYPIVKCSIAESILSIGNFTSDVYKTICQGGSKYQFVISHQMDPYFYSVSFGVLLPL